MTEQTKIAAISFTAETRSKQEMVDHLMQVHGIGAAGGHYLTTNAKRTRATKEEMEKIHDAAHRILDHPADELLIQDDYVHVPGMRSRTPRPSVPHVHDEPAVAPEVSSMLEAVRSGGGSILPAGKVMPPAQRTVLTKLVNNDFAALRADLQSLAAASLENDLKQLELEWEDRRAKAATWKGEVTKLGRKTVKKLERIKEAALEDGIEINIPSRVTDYIRADARTAGYDKALADAKNRNKRALDVALLKLERERLRLERRILLAGVEPEAAEVLEAVPSAQEMMQDAMTREAQGAMAPNT